MTTLKRELKELLLKGTVIPAHPLALGHHRKLDPGRQKALTRYYLDSGAGGIAVGVHTTQFEIRAEQHQLYQLVLELAAEVVAEASLSQPIIKVAGITGPTDQAVSEAETAMSLGYDIGLVSMGGLGSWSEQELIERTNILAEIIPIFGFYLQPAVGGRLLSYDFWRAFAEIPNVHAIKIAPFNRYQTLDVVRAVCHSSRYQDIALYTGNDDNIVLDLLTTYRFKVNQKWREKSIVGGLLGQWAVWTSKAVELLDSIHKVKQAGVPISPALLTTAVDITDANAAIFDASNNFKGCIAGIHEVLRRQGLLKGIWCLDPADGLSPGQREEIDRVYKDYPELNDDDFVQSNLERWIQ